MPAQQKEALWLQSFVTKILETKPAVMKINSDSQGAIAFVRDNKYHSQTKYIDLCYHFIQEAVEDKKISINYIPTDNNPSDLLTKALTRLTFESFIKLLGLRELERKGKEERTTRKKQPIQTLFDTNVSISCLFVICLCFLSYLSFHLDHYHNQLHNHVDILLITFITSLNYFIEVDTHSYLI